MSNLKDIENLTIQEKVTYFKEVVCDSKKLQEVLKLQIVNHGGIPALQYNFNFFSMFCNNNQYSNMILNIMDNAYQIFLKSNNYTKENYCYILSNMFYKII